MMNPEYIAEALEITLGSSLVVKLLNLRLHVVYRLFSFFLVSELLGSLTWVVQRFLGGRLGNLDYRLLFVAERALVCPLIILTVYALLEAVLQELPGILTFSRRLMKIVFGCAAIIGLLSAAWESQRVTFMNGLEWQDKVLLVGLLADRVVSSVVLLSIVSILSFLLAFPVQVPRNLAVFIFGFAVYSAGTLTGLLFQSLVVHNTSRWVSTAIEFLVSACFAYWAIFITQAGEYAPAKLNVRRDPLDQNRLIRSLELLNESLLRSADR